MRVRSAILCVLVSMGCADARGDDTTMGQPLEAAAPTPAPPRVAASHEANEAERAAKRASADPTPIGPVALDVDWDEVTGFKRLEPTLLPASEQAKLTEVQLPVLAFDDAALLRTALLSHLGNWYVIAVEAAGLHMNIRGTRNAYTVPGMEIPEAARKAADNYTLTRTDGIVTVSWRAFNVSYNVDVECSKPMDDPRCTEDEFALRTVEDLGVIGGQR